jgi:hypothetical protein
MLIDSCVIDIEGFPLCGRCGGEFVPQEVCVMGFDSSRRREKLHLRIQLDDDVYVSVMGCKRCSGSARFVIDELTGLPLRAPEGENTMSAADAREKVLEFVRRYSTVWAKGKKLDQKYLGPTIRVEELEDLGCPKASKEKACLYHQPTEQLTHCAFCDVVCYIKWFISLP